MSDLSIRVEVYSRQPDQARLAVADRYVERAAQAVDRRDRAALSLEAERIYREEYR